MKLALVCTECGRFVPVAPGHLRVSVPHVDTYRKPCDGNEKRQWREALEHPAIRLARQRHVFDTDAYWEGL